MHNKRIIIIAITKDFTWRQLIACKQQCLFAKKPDCRHAAGKGNMPRYKNIENKACNH